MYVCVPRMQCECGCTQVVSVHCVVRSLFCGYCALRTCQLNLCPPLSVLVCPRGGSRQKNLAHPLLSHSSEFVCVDGPTTPTTPALFLPVSQFAAPPPPPTTRHPSPLGELSEPPHTSTPRTDTHTCTHAQIRTYIHTSVLTYLCMHVHTYVSVVQYVYRVVCRHT